MPSTRHSEEPEERSFSVTLTVYSTVKKKTKGKSSTAATKEEKSLKRKELLFAVNDGNYLEFLQSILEKVNTKSHRGSAFHSNLWRSRVLYTRDFLIPRIPQISLMLWPSWRSVGI
jgi:hypothetical protein